MSSILCIFLSSSLIIPKELALPSNVSKATPHFYRVDAQDEPGEKKGKLLT